jgi:predicted DCC family thiol-disulfide oxidoreductase YuxK
VDHNGQSRTVTDTSTHPIIVFDAECVLCSANAQFVLRHDTRGHFRLASMQGEAGADLYRRFGIDPTDPESLIVVEGDRAYRDSDAILVIYTGLGRPWRALATVGRLVPRFIRNPVYRAIARNRYRLFGRREACWMPTPDQAERVL